MTDKPNKKEIIRKLKTDKYETNTERYSIKKSKINKTNYDENTSS